MVGENNSQIAARSVCLQERDESRLSRRSSLLNAPPLGHFPVDFGGIGRSSTPRDLPAILRGHSSSAPVTLGQTTSAEFWHRTGVGPGANEVTLIYDVTLAMVVSL